jgi:small conductance mechanosensitive channel
MLIMSSVLGTVGFDTKPIVAGLGVTGFTVGFALKDVATNYLSGLLLVLNRPFKQGWRVRLFNGSTAFEGIVKAVDTRYVHLEMKDKHRILLPSYVVYSNPIVVLESIDDEKSKSN